MSASVEIGGRYGKWQSASRALPFLPDVFIVFDLETTGLDPDTNEIIEIGAIRVNRNADVRESFQFLVRPVEPIPQQITQLTGITQAMVDADGQTLNGVLHDFLEFIGDLPLVTFAADFDMAFVRNAMRRLEPRRQLANPVSCALKMARRAWPSLNSYRLVDLDHDDGSPATGAHRALGDSERALRVYCAAAAILGTPR